jgi:endo-1,4-beta-xylanase
MVRIKEKTMKKALVWRRFIVLPLVIIAFILSSSTFQTVNASDALRVHATARNFLIGAAVAASPVQNNATYANLAKTEFNLLTPENEMKMDALQPTEGNFAYANADAIVNFANTNSMKVHGHTLVWGNQFPGWLNSKTRDRVTFLPIMQNGPGMSSTRPSSITA